MLRRVGEYPPEPVLVIQSRGQHLALGEEVRDSSELAKREQRAAHLQPEVDRLLDDRTGLREMLERVDRSVERNPRLAVSRASKGLRPCLAKIPDSFRPHFSTERVEALASHRPFSRRAS